MQRFWIFQLSAPLSEMQSSLLGAEIACLLLQWKTHGQAMKAEYRLLHQQFLYIHTPEGTPGASGCSIDSLKSGVTEILKKMHLTDAGAGTIFYRTGKGFSPIPFAEVKKAIETGQLRADTEVIDLSLGGTENPDRICTALSNTWMRRYLPTEV